MQRNKSLLFFCFFIFPFATKCFSLSVDSSSVKVSGYVNAYYAYYTDSVGVGKFQQFPSVSPRSNQFGLNIANITVQYNSEKTRAIVTLQYGDIPLSAWSVTYNPLMEAHAGIRLSKKFLTNISYLISNISYLTSHI